MTREEAHRAVFWRNVLLWCAAIALLAALAEGFRPWEALHSPQASHVLLLLFGSGCCVALGTREFAGLLFDVRAMPWYAQRGGILFLGFMLGMTHSVVARLLSRIDPQTGSRDVLLAGIATSILAVLLLDWMPSLPKERRERRRRRRKVISDPWCPPPASRDAPFIEGAAAPRKKSKLKKLLRWLLGVRHGSSG